MSQVIAGGTLRVNGGASASGQEVAGESDTVQLGGATINNLSRIVDGEVEKIGAHVFTFDKQHNYRRGYIATPMNDKVTYSMTLAGARLEQGSHATQGTAIAARNPGQTVTPTQGAGTVAAIVETPLAPNADGSPGGVIRTTGAHLAIRSNSLYSLAPGNAGHLVETDPRFTNYRQWLSSDYMLSALSLDPATEQKRLGDGFYEQKLIREQVAQLTGRRYLGDFSSEQGRTTLSAGGDLKLGTVTTRHSEDTVWNGDHRRTGTSRREVGSRISGANVALDAGGDLSARAAQITATTGVAELSAGRDVKLSAGQTYTQTGSDVVAPQGDVNISARKVDITEARETGSSQTEQRFKQSGITVAASAPIVSAAQTLANTAQATATTRIGRMQPLGAATVALQAKDIANYADTAGIKPTAARTQSANGKRAQRRNNWGPGMSVLSDVQQFLSDLVLGDFADNPSSASIVVNGAIGLLPIVDQVLDARDVTAQVLICSEMGWGKLEEDNYANLAFTAIGLIPSFGSFFKGAVKPLWRERKLVGRGVQSGVAMLERALGMGKGGVVKWVNAINWALRTEQAAYAAQSALDSYIGMLQTIAQAPWWAPSWLVRQAKYQIPVAQQAKLYVSQAIKRGSKLIEGFLKDLLGEHAVWVLVAATAAQTSMSKGRSQPSAASIKANAGVKLDSKKKSTTAAQTGPSKGARPSTPAKPERHKKVQDSAQTQARKSGAVVHASMETTRKFIDSFAKRSLGVIAEHMVDQYVLEAYAGQHVHGSVKRQKQGQGNLVKFNEPYRPVQLEPLDLAQLTTSGIDSLWRKRDGRYLVVETKGRVVAPSKSKTETKNDTNKRNYARKRAQEKGRGWNEIPEVPAGLNVKEAQLWRMLHDNYDKSGNFTGMQMTNVWVEKDMERLLAKSVNPSMYTREVYLVVADKKEFAVPAAGYTDHALAIPGIIDAVSQRPENTTQDYPQDHDKHKATHGISVKYGEAEVAKVEGAREEGRTDTSSRKTPSTSQTSRTGTGRSPRKTGRN